jgi:CAAX prenyl protease-like protein
VQSHRRQIIAHVLPMFVFLALLALSQLLSASGGRFLLRHAEFWIYPAQTVLCGVLLVWFRRCYEFHRLKNVAFTLLIALAVFAIWIAPQQFFGFEPRKLGFDPTVFGNNSGTFWLSVAFRFLRLVVVVPVMEEIFWRSFLLRFVIDERFEQVPFGKFSWLSFAIVTVVFTFSHSRPDWLAAFVAGALYNAVAYRTRSLSSCILAHALTNLVLGFWIMQTRQWGFW